MLRWHAVAADGPREEDRRIQAAEEGGERADGLDERCEGHHGRAGQNRVSY